MVRIVCISDTHNQLDQVDIPSGDILIHAGDLTGRGNPAETREQITLLATHAAKFKHIILISGNHDWLGERNPGLVKEFCKEKGIIYLDHEPIELEGLKFFGSAYTPEFHGWAFNVSRGEELAKKWAQIPEDTDVLITHGPPHMILDFTPPMYAHLNKTPNVGCEDLANRVMNLKLKLHVFGHIHYAYGQLELQGTKFVNASTCTEQYRPTNPPIIIDL